MKFLKGFTACVLHFDIFHSLYTVCKNKWRISNNVLQTNQTTQKFVLETIEMYEKEKSKEENKKISMPKDFPLGF